MSKKTVLKTSAKQYIENIKKALANNKRQSSQLSLFLDVQEPQLSISTPLPTNELKNINIENIKAFLGEDWDDYKNNPEALILWDDLLSKNRLIEKGKIPNNFTAITCCDLCGDVYVPPSLVNGGRVLGCPWCWNKTKGLPKPTKPP